MNYGAWNAQALLQTSTHGIPTGDFGSIFNDKNARRGNQRFSFAVQRLFDLDSNRQWEVRSFLDLTNVRLTYPIRFDLESTSLETLYEIRLNQQSIGAETVYRWDLRSDNRLMIGAQFIRHYKVSLSSKARFQDTDTALDFFGGSFPYHQFSVFVQDEYQVHENVFLTLGLRQDLYSRAGSATSPRIALVFHPFETSAIKLLYGDAFRAPNTFEVNFSGVVERIEANPDLLPERIHTQEVVWEQRLAKQWSGSLSLYNYRLRNLIEAHDDPNSDTRYFDNVPGMESRGVEFELEYRPSQVFDAYFSYGYQTTHRREDPQPVVNAPANLMSARFQYSGFRTIDIAAELDAAGSRFTNQGNRTPGYFIANLHTTSKKLFDLFRVRLSIFNLFDKAYYTPGGRYHLQDRFLQERRSFRFQVSLAL